MRKYTRRILLLLALGVVTTYVLAWIMLIWRPGRAVSGRVENGAPRQPYDDWWTAHAPQNWPARPDNVTHYTTIGYAHEYYFQSEFTNLDNDLDNDLDTNLDNKKEHGTISHQIAGWPMLAIDGWHGVEYDNDGNQLDTFNVAQITLDWRRVGFPHVRLPLRPLAPGFLIDTGFHTAAWFTLLFVPGITRRFIRRKRGRCPKCGYNLRGEFDGGCSECGWNRLVEGPDQ